MSTETSLRSLTSDEIEKLFSYSKFKFEYAESIKQIEFNIQKISKSEFFETFKEEEDMYETYEEDIGDFIGNIITILHGDCKKINLKDHELFEERYKHIENIVRNYFMT